MMNRHELLKKLSIKSDSKIVMMVMDGLGGLPDEKTGLTELEAAHSPNLDRVAQESVCGLSIPIAPGITPGSGPAHLSLFGYDPLEHEIGRGILGALGIDFPVEKNDVAARINFCSIDDHGFVTDRRAGRIPTEKNAELSKKIEENVKVPGVQVFFRPEKEHRAALIIRGENLSDALSDTDPQKTGLKPLLVHPVSDSEEAKNTAVIANEIISQIKNILKDDHPANMVLARGFSKYPKIETMGEIYKLRCAAIAVYPMYRGLAKLVGMDVLPAPKDVPGEFELLKKVYNDYDFFFMHIKGTDSAGEDGDYQRKKKVIEDVDKLVPQIMELNPDVFIVTGDHSTPSQMKAHSWHPVPTLIRSKYARPDQVNKYGEREVCKGLLGNFFAIDIMSLAMAKALKLEKYGA
jgi:2,3-bisphosphoglycerate-independent phosphoglycerate mutase